MAERGAGPRAAVSSAPADESSRLAALRRKLPLGLALGAAVALALGIAGDAPKVAAALAGFRWELLPIILVLTLVNYLVRFVKWQIYLRLIGAPPIPSWESFLLFFSGLAMTITPGKVGEWLKSYLLRERYGVPISVSAPIILAERLTDGVAMLLLALGGLFAYGYGRELLAAIGLGALALVLATQVPAAQELALAIAAGLPVVRGKVGHLRAFLESTRRLFALGPLVLAIGMGVVSWGAECVAFYLVLVGLGVAGGAELLLQASFVLASATIVGSASMLPGGLAVAEGGITGMLLLLDITPDRAIAAAATLLIRAGTLWFGVAVGVIALTLLARRAPELTTPPHEAAGC
jgi:glycosyltransferase 2 family protein